MAAALSGPALYRNSTRAGGDRKVRNDPRAASLTANAKQNRHLFGVFRLFRLHTQRAQVGGTGLDVSVTVTAQVQGRAQIDTSEQLFFFWFSLEHFYPSFEGAEAQLATLF